MFMKKRLLFIFLSILWVFHLQGQEQDSTLAALENDSLPAVEIEKWLPNPGRALRLSLILPGAGQVYNKRWWKLPLVYAAYGGVVYAIDYNQGWLTRFRTAFEAQIQNPPQIHEFSELGLGTTELKAFRDKFDKQLQLSYIGLILVHGLVSMEAFVDAHLQSFDIDDDLTLQIKPDVFIDPLSRQPVFSISGVLGF